MHKVAFLTTVFPMNLIHLTEMFDSLVNQSTKEFDLVVVNDGLKEFDAFISHYTSRLNIIELEGTGNPIENRQVGINYCVENNYTFLIFGDSDDTFSSNRIEVSVEQLHVFDIVVNDLTLFNSKELLEENYLSKRLQDNEKIEFDFIRNKNIFGLSNTAITLNRLLPVVFPVDLIAADWYFFSVLLLQNRRSVFTNKTVTNYRQYEGNLVGLKKIDEESFLRGVKVKELHYQALKKITDKVDNEYQRYCHSNIVFKDHNELAYPLWWELI